MTRYEPLSFDWHGEGREQSGEETGIWSAYRQVLHALLLRDPEAEASLA